MPTHFTKGDIFETEGVRAYAFGAVIDGTMDTGLASAMKKRWPELAEAYAERCKDNSLQLGDVFVWTQRDITVYALAIQRAGEGPKMTALAGALGKMLSLATEAKVGRIGLPRIGTGPGGLDWTRVRKMLSEISVGKRVRLEVFEQFVRARKDA